MTKDELLKGIIETIDPMDEITLDTEIAECDDLDSLGLFNIVMYLKSRGISVKLEHLAACTTVDELLDMVLES